jgi:hypothetical protein
MAANQVLAYHKAGEQIYNLTGLRTGSVRDQMLRAILLTEALVRDSKEITDKTNYGLLVIGGGVAGVACALIAAKLNVQVTLVEIRRKPFFTLQHARSRRIDPFEYDWPQPDSHVPFRANFPTHPVFPLRYAGGTAAQVARGWQADFDNLQKWGNQPKGRPGHLEFIPRLDGSKFQFNVVPGPLGRRVEVSGIWNPLTSVSASKLFGAVIVCAGFGKERTFDEQHRFAFVGPAFWIHNDNLETPSFGMKCPSVGTYPRILISGGGDGAMQDLQRAATGMFGAPLLKKLLGVFDKASSADVRLACMLADDRAKRAYAWKPSDGPSKDIPNEMREWHRAYERIVADVISDYATQQGIDDRSALVHLAQKILKPEVYQSPKAQVIWAVLDGHTGFAYALNRFLSIFIVRMLDAVRPGVDSLKMGTEIVKIAPHAVYPHPCGSGRACHGVPHAVTFKGAAVAEDFDVVVLRHGLLPNPISNLPTGPTIPEQMAPYDLPI